MKLSAYQNILVFYERFQDRYGWRVSDVDDSEMCVLLDQMIAVSAVDNPPPRALSIEDVT